MTRIHYWTFICWFIIIILVIYLFLSVFAIFSFPKNVNSEFTSDVKFDKNITVNGDITATTAEFTSMNSAVGNFNNVTSANLSSTEIRGINDTLSINPGGTTTINNLITGTFAPQNISTTNLNAETGTFTEINSTTGEDLSLNPGGTTIINNLNTTGTFAPQNISTTTINGNNGVLSLNETGTTTAGSLVSTGLTAPTISGVDGALSLNPGGTTTVNNLNTTGTFAPQNISTTTLNGTNGALSLNEAGTTTTGNINSTGLTAPTINGVDGALSLNPGGTTTVNSLSSATINGVNGDLSLNETGTTTTGNIAANKISAAAQLGIAVLTSSQIAALTGNQLGDIVFNSTLGNPMFYNGTAYQSWSGGGGGGFDPSLSNLETGDGLYYNGSVWKNGYYMAPPELTYTLPFTINFSNFITPFFWNNTSANMQIYLKIYSDPGLTNEIVNTNLAGNSWMGTSSILAYSATYYAVGQYENILYPNSLSSESAILTFTTPLDDLIAEQLTTSLAAYKAAPINSAVNITQTEYQNIQANVTGTVLSGNTNPFINPGSTGTFNIAITNNVLTPFPANSYFIAYSYMSYGSTSSSGYFAFANNQVISASSPVYPWVSSVSEVLNQTYYYCIKAPPTPLSGNASLVPIVLSNNTIPFVAGSVLGFSIYNAPLPTYSPGDVVVLNQVLDNGRLLCVNFSSTPNKNW